MKVNLFNQSPFLLVMNNCQSIFVKGYISDEGIQAGRPASPPARFKPAAKRRLLLWYRYGLKFVIASGHWISSFISRCSRSVHVTVT